MVVPIPYYEWARLETQEDKYEYLHQQLDAAQQESKAADIGGGCVGGGSGGRAGGADSWSWPPRPL